MFVLHWLIHQAYQRISLFFFLFFFCLLKCETVTPHACKYKEERGNCSGHAESTLFSPKRESRLRGEEFVWDVAGREYFNEMEKIIWLRLCTLKCTQSPSSLIRPVLLLLQVLVNECFSHYNCDPTTTLIRYIFCDLGRMNCQRLPVSLPHLMTWISVIRWTRSILLRAAHCIMTDLLGAVRFEWNASGTSRT